ncbi:hypothetical protein ACFL1Y_02015 [Patescibacteria group bacterium]
MENTGMCIVLANTKSLISAEFNDMDLSNDSIGMELLRFLERANSFKSAKIQLNNFNNSCAGINNKPIYLVIKKFKSIVFKEKTYHRDFHASYLYIKNQSLFKRKIVTVDNKVFWLYPNEIVVLYKGLFLMSYNFIQQKYAYVQLKCLPTQQYQGA